MHLCRCIRIKNYMITSKRLFVGLLLSLTVATQVLASESLEQTIGYLLNYVANSKVTLIRNGATHTPDEAVKHIKTKYEHFKSEIKDALV